MINILCLESKNNMVTCGQVFKASLFMLVHSSKISPKKWNVIAPTNTTKASYNKIFKYDCNVSSFMHNFVSANSLALASVILGNNGNNKVKYLLEMSRDMDDVISLSYINLKIPSLIPINEAHKYIHEVSEQISKNVKEYYSLLSEE